MGLVHVDLQVANPADPRRSVTVRCLVDSGALYSVVPRTDLRRLGIAPYAAETFSLADGSEIRRKIGGALFRLGRRRGVAPVIFGERGDSALLGTTSLEAMGLMLDPIRRELRPTRLVLAQGVPAETGGQSTVGNTWRAGRDLNPRSDP